MSGSNGAVALAGSGLVGSNWAIVFARAGHSVRLWDHDPDQPKRARDNIADNARDLVEAGLLEAADPLIDLIDVAPDLETALDGVVHVQESIVEKAEVKADLFSRLDALAPDSATIASSSSAIPGSRFMEHLPGRGRCMIAHPANPPYLLPIVELVPTPWTTDEAVAAAREMFVATGQQPIHVKKEVPGFILSRIQIALINECISLVGRDVVSPDDVDKVMKYGLGLRWAFLGPLEVMDLNGPTGFASYVDHLRPTFEEVGDDLHTSDRWTEEAVAEIDNARRAHVPADDVTERQRWRDRRLMALLAHLKAAESDIGP